MKRFWRGISFVLVFTLVLSLSGFSTAFAAEKSKTVEITLTSWRTEEINAFKILNDAFMKTHPNIKVKYAPIKNTEYDSQLSMSFTTKSAADIVYVRPFDRGYNLFKSGNLLEINEKNIPNLKNFPKSQIDIYRSPDGKVFAVPYIYVSYGFIYNKELFDKYGLKAPKTWDEFYKVAETLKKNKVTPLALGTKDAWVLNEVVSFGNYANFAGGETWRQELLKGKASFTDPGFVAHLENINKWKEYMPANYQALGYTDAQQLFLTGQAAIFPAGSWEIGYFKSMNPNLKMGVFPSPVEKAGDKQWVGFNGGAGLGINKNSKNIAAALTYVNWLSSPEAQILTGNLMAGLYPCANIDTSKLTDPLAKQWLSWGGKKGENLAIGWGLEKINQQEPSAGTLTLENLTLMLNGSITPKEAAKKIQDGVASWYAPFKK